MSYEKRKDRISNIKNKWQLTSIHDLMLSHLPEKSLMDDFKLSTMLYISKAFNLKFSDDENIFIERLNENKNYNLNITPNGAIVPKKEYQLEFNLVLRSWTQIIQNLIKNQPELLSKIRITPNIRIKFGEETKENIGRPLNTSYPHSDAWLDDRMGINCYVPLFGDIDRNNMDFYEPNPDTFEERFLNTAKTYEEMQWVLEYYKKASSIIPRKGFIHLSDFALIHGTSRKQPCGTRVSIDTTLYVDSSTIHEDRKDEYLDKVKIFGEEIFMSTTRSINESTIHNKKTEFSHYTTGTTKIINI